MEKINFTKKNLIKLQDTLKKQNKTITTAESCTGGLIASKITSISGSSQIFKGAIVTYSNQIKEQELKVKKETMIKYGVVSYQVVEQMLAGVIKKFKSNYAIAVSGVAGPTGGTKKKPVGTVVIGVAYKKNNKNIEKNITTVHLKGTRKQIQLQTTKIALSMALKEALKNN